MAVEEKTVRILMLLFLGWNSISDLRKKKISGISVIGFGVLGLILILWRGSEKDVAVLLKDLFCSSIPGVLLCMLSKVSRGSVGMGDGILVMVMGIYIGIYRIIITAAWAFFLALFWGIGLLCLGKKNKQYAFPFIPFLMLGYLIHMYFL